MDYKRNILITGGAGFIGSHLVRLFVNKYPDYRIINFDALTYAGNLENLSDVENFPNYVFVLGDITDFKKVSDTLVRYHVDAVIHLAAESHVDRSIKDPLQFVRTNVMGTITLLEAARQYWESLPEGYDGKIFYHISTDEIYGSLPLDAPQGVKAPFTTMASAAGHLAFGTTFFTESSVLDPRSPYSASKASANHFVSAYHHTYGLPTLITSCSNNYGPYQFPEKLIPLFINNILNGKELPVYGAGDNVRDWLYVEDHARAIDVVFHRAAPGSVYNIGGFNEWRNIDLVNLLIQTVDRLTEKPVGHSKGLITHITDRKGHDKRYAIDSRRIRQELGWEPSLNFEQGLEKTVLWYLSNPDWLNHVTSGEYLKYYEEMYKPSAKNEQI